MSCSLDGAKCDDSSQCLLSDITTQDLCANYGCVNGRCTSKACSTDGDCAKFGEGSTCYAGYCNQMRCRVPEDCSTGFDCKNGKCILYDCSTSPCKDGMTCKKLSDGSKVCVINPGVNWFRLIVMFLIAITLSVAAIAIVYYVESSGGHIPIISDILDKL